MPFLGCLSLAAVRAHSEELRIICTAIFGSFKLDELIIPADVTLDMISGLSVFVWHCAPAALKGTDAFYDNLYCLFAGAPGQGRRQVVATAMAIEKVTGVSLAARASLPGAHRKLIRQLEVQFGHV